MDQIISLQIMLFEIALYVYYLFYTQK